MGSITPLSLNPITGWRCVANATPQPFYPKERTPVPNEQETGSDPGPV
jgi:hypothetical protein